MCGFLGVVGADCAPVTNQQKDHVNAASPMQSFYEPLSNAQNHSPIRLLGEDGTPLKLNSLIIRGQINEPLAVTELELEFVNPERRSFNANFEMDLPSGAQVQRFAVFRDQQWEFAEVVSRDESEGHGTHLSGPSQRRNHQLFAAQLSEISASQTTRLSITYSQEIRNHSHPYQIFLAGLPKLARIDIQLHGQDLQVKTGDGYVQRISEKQAVFRLAETNYQPQRNLRIELPKVSGIAVHHENMLVTRLSPVDHDHQAPIASIAILFDTSASQGYHFATQLQRLKDLIAALKEQAGQQVQLQVLCFDQEIQPIFAGSIGDFGHDQVKAIQRRKALGASDLAGALRYISARQGQANQQISMPQRLVLLTDAVNTTELGGASSLQEEFLRLKQAGVKRLDFLINGYLQTASIMDQLATANFPEPGLLISADTPAKQLAIKLLRTVVAGVNVEIPGSDWIYPQTLQSVQSDDEVFVYAGMPSQIFSRQAHDIQLKLSGAIRGTQIIPVQQVSSSLVEKLWAHAFVDYLYQQQQECTVGDLCNMWKERAIRASVDHGVLNEFTALSLNTREKSMRQAVLSVVPEYRSWRIHTASTPSLPLAQKMPSPILENALAKRWKESRQKSNEIWLIRKVLQHNIGRKGHAIGSDFLTLL